MLLLQAVLQAAAVVGMQQCVPELLAQQSVADPTIFAPEGLGHGAHGLTRIRVALLRRKIAAEQFCSELE